MESDFEFEYQMSLRLVHKLLSKVDEIKLRDKKNKYIATKDAVESKIDLEECKLFYLSILSAETKQSLIRPLLFLVVKQTLSLFKAKV